MQYIYSRVSTSKQDTQNQLSKLTELYPTAKIYEEEASSTKFRPVLYGLLSSILKPRDILIVISLDRLARKVTEALRIIEHLENSGVTLISVNDGANYSTPAGKFLTQILCSVAEMERNLISERTKEGLAARRKQGVVLGRRPYYTEEDVDRVKELRATGLTLRAIERITRISHATCFRMLKEVKNENDDHGETG